jgi:hypothetical protein
MEKKASKIIPISLSKNDENSPENKIRKSCNSDQLSSKSPENARCGSLDTNFVIITWWHPTGRLQKQFFIDALECILACAMVTLISLTCV